ncbi:MAG TPA: D-aminoacyl-tRNA deacylase [Acidimicrobiia bacterium]
MRVVLQRVKRASVRVAGDEVAAIGLGLLLLVGIEEGDGEEEAASAVAKLAGLRVFPDADGKMNLSVLDVGGEVLVVSQFTLLGDMSRGRRPSFTSAAAPDVAAPLIDYLVAELRGAGVPTRTGVFGASMEVELVNDGPVTLVLDVPNATRG